MFKIEEKYLSEHQKELGRGCGVKFGGEKLCLTLKDKEKYILHYRNLKQYLSLGLKLKKVDRVLKFKQSPWMNEYIDMNTLFRMEAKNNFEVNLYKLMNNSVFGKTCEDVRKYTEVKIVNSEEGIDKLSMKEQFKRWHIYNPNLAAVIMEKKSVKLNKPRYIGSTILALSKTLMYDFHYNYMMKKFPNCKVLFTDTDSLCYSIPNSENVYEELGKSDRFDFSNFPKNHSIYSEKNKMIPGKFKDECPNDTIMEFAGLRAKMYSILTINGCARKAANGVSRRVTNKEIKHENFKTCLIENEVMYHNMSKIGHTHHSVETQHTMKRSLNPYNDKKWINKNGDEFETYSFGHRKLEGELFLSFL